MKASKAILVWGIILAIAPFGYAQSTSSRSTTVTISYETGDASQFGYDPWEKGLRVAITRKLTERWEAIASGGISDQHKNYIGDGKHADGSLGVRFYLANAMFLTAGGIMGRDWNSQYTKWAIRGFVGIGAKAYGFTGTLTVFGPPTDLAVDPNQVKGVNLLVEYSKPLVGPLALYTSLQGSLASFIQTGGNASERFNGMVWKGRAGVRISF